MEKKPNENYNYQPKEEKESDNTSDINYQQKKRKRELNARLEKKYPKIRVNNEIFNRLVALKSEFNFNSFNEVIIMLLDFSHHTDM